MGPDLIVNQFESYFPSVSAHYFLELPIPDSIRISNFETTLIDLPQWAAGIGVGESNSLLVPSCCICEDNDRIWSNVDWWRAITEFLTCKAEYSYELRNGPVHSYAYKLPDTLFICWERAWVNRIFLFLRRWVAHLNNAPEEELLGDIPRGVIHLTHDVDYVSKTLALRLKQVAFIQYNILKCLLQGNFSAAAELFPRMFRFGLGPANYWQFPVIRELEAEHDVTSSWNFYGGVGGFTRSPSELLLDPSYRVAEQKISRQLSALLDEKNRVGLHQGFHSWQDSKRMLLEKKRLEEAVRKSVDSCRQHWLRFSFDDTWKAQEAAGFKLDSTLGFNDRHGFRNSAALRIPAWIGSDQRFSVSLDTLPMILMDSHLFDYGQLAAEARKQVIDYYLDEVAFVGGEATVIWHHRVFHSDYGWGNDYRYLLEGIRKRSLSTGSEVT